MTDTSSPSFVSHKLNRLPRKSGAVIQGGLFLEPTWTTDDDTPGAPPYRSLMVLWNCDFDYRLNQSSRGQPKLEYADALQTLVHFCTDSNGIGFRPETIEVRDPTLREYLQNQLRGSGIHVVYRECLPRVDSFMQDLTKQLQSQTPIPNPLAEDGVTVNAMRAFAEAAAEFHRAAPWRHLCDVDLLRVDSPKSPDPALQYFSVFGNAGKTFGLGFYLSPKILLELHETRDPTIVHSGSVWMLTFHGRSETPFADDDLWQEHQLPLAGEYAYPSMMCILPNGRARRPNLKQLTFTEGLLRSLARSTAEQLNSRSLEMAVPTHKGKKKYILTRLDLHEAARDCPLHLSAGPPPIDDNDDATYYIIGDDYPYDGPTREDYDDGLPQDDDDDITSGYDLDLPPDYHDDDDDVMEKALDLCQQAYASEGDHRILLSRQALDLWPDCTEAYLILADATDDLREKLELLNNAVDAGKRIWNEDSTDSNYNYFGMLLEAQPFVYAVLQRGVLLFHLGRFKEAIQDFRDCQRLALIHDPNPLHCLIASLLADGQLDEAETLLRKHKASSSLFWSWANAFFTYLRKGPCAVSTRRLRHAHNLNITVAELLLKKTFYPPHPIYQTQRSAEDSIMCSHLLRPTWDKNPHMTPWLLHTLKLHPSPSPRRLPQ